MKEAELYEPIKMFFEKQNFGVFAEVQLPYSRRRVDVIAKQVGNEDQLIAIELKVSFSKDLVTQAIRSRQTFPYVYVAVPERKRKIPNPIKERLAYYGIGILEVVTIGERQEVKVRQQAIYRKPKKRYRKTWDELLLPEHQTWKPGGSAGGGFVTDYALTIARVKEYLQTARDSHDGTMGWRSAKQIADHCPSHWASPKKQVVDALLSYEMRWCEAQKYNNRWHFRARATDSFKTERAGAVDKL